MYLSNQQIDGWTDSREMQERTDPNSCIILHRGGENNAVKTYEFPCSQFPRVCARFNSQIRIGLTGRMRVRACVQNGVIRIAMSYAHRAHATCARVLLGCICACNMVLERARVSILIRTPRSSKAPRHSSAE